MQVNIISDTNRRIPRKRIKKLIALIEEEEEPPDKCLNLIFTRDRRITALNEQFLGRGGPTDVISFNLDDDLDDDCLFGEVYISTDTAARNARKLRVPFGRELMRLCVHGLLHLLGYDHENEKDRTLMVSREHHFLGRVG